MNLEHLSTLFTAIMVSDTGALLQLWLLGQESMWNRPVGQDGCRDQLRAHRVHTFSKPQQLQLKQTCGEPIRAVAEHTGLRRMCLGPLMLMQANVHQVCIAIPCHTTASGLCECVQ